MNNHLAGSGALDQDKGHAADLCNRNWLDMAASCVSSTHVKRIERSRRLPAARERMNNHLTGSGALGRDQGHAADLCNRNWSCMAASCVSSTHVKRIERSRRRRFSWLDRSPNILEVVSLILTLAGPPHGRWCLFQISLFN